MDYFNTLSKKINKYKKKYKKKPRLVALKLFIWNFLCIFRILKASGKVKNPQQELLLKIAKNAFLSRVYSIDTIFEAKKIPYVEGEKIKIHFLYLVDSYWPSWGSFYNACVQDERVEVKVILLDVSDMDSNSSQHVNQKRFLIDNKIQYVDSNVYCIEKEKPHVLVYQTPYDYWFKTRNFPKWRADYIKKCGIRPVYISYGIEFDISVTTKWMQSIHCGQLVQQTAWRVYVMHEDIKSYFYENCATGGAHVRVLGHPKFDSYHKPGEDMKLPEHIVKKAKGRKIVTYQIHAPNDSDCKGRGRYHTLSFREHVNILKAMQECSDLFFIITIHPAFESKSLNLSLVTEEEINDFHRQIEDGENTLLYRDNYQVLLIHSDAFLSELSSLLVEMAYFTKPVMYLYDMPVLMKPFAQKIIDSYYHGNCAEDVVSYLNILQGKAEDSKRALREAVREEIFSSYDGQIGIRIKEEIVNEVMDENARCTDIHYPEPASDIWDIESNTLEQDETESAAVIARDTVEAPLNSAIKGTTGSTDTRLRSMSVSIVKDAYAFRKYKRMTKWYGICTHLTFGKTKRNYERKKLELKARMKIVEKYLKRKY